MSFSLRWKCALAPVAVLLLLAMLSAAGALGVAYASVRPRVATASSSLSLHESIQASLVSHRGATSLNERGHGSGTFNCSLAIHINISYTQARIEYTCNTNSGMMSGAGTVSYYVNGPSANFNGSLYFTHGSRRYAHVSGSAGNIRGTLARGSYALSAVVTGRIKI